MTRVVLCCIVLCCIVLHCTVLYSLFVGVRLRPRRSRRLGLRHKPKLKFGLRLRRKLGLGLAEIQSPKSALWSKPRPKHKLTIKLTRIVKLSLRFVVLCFLYCIVKYCVGLGLELKRGHGLRLRHKPGAKAQAQALA